MCDLCRCVRVMNTTAMSAEVAAPKYTEVHRRKTIRVPHWSFLRARLCHLIRAHCVIAASQSARRRAAGGSQTASFSHLDCILIYTPWKIKRKNLYFFSKKKKI